jgi:hypothetical protein
LFLLLLECCGHRQLLLDPPGDLGRHRLDRAAQTKAQKHKCGTPQKHH